MGNQAIILTTMGVYMLMMIGIGIYFAKKNENSSDFFLGGRGLGPWVAAMSAEASDMSSWLLMGLPGLAYATGVADATWTAIGLAVGTYINWRIVAVPIRKYTQIAKNSITLPDFFSNRFHDEKKILMSIAAVITFIFFIVYTASGFSSCGKLFNSLFGYDYKTTMIVCAIVIVAYTTIGGFLAASTTDFIQGLLMSASLAIIVVIAIIQAGGIGSVLEHAASLPGYISLTSSYDPVTNTASTYGLVTILSGIAWGLGYFGMPHVLVRFMAIRNSSELKKSRIIATTWCIISLFVAVLIGLIGKALYPDMLSGAKVETIFIVLSNTLLPAIWVGVVLSGVLAATMSTADSQLLVTASAVSQNLYKGLFKKDATQKQVMWVSRLTVVIVAIFAAVIALDENSKIFDLVSYAWAGFGAAFGPLVLFSLFWKRTTLGGAIAGMLGGGICVVIWKNLIKPMGGWFGIYELAPAFLLSCILIYVVSKMGPEPCKEIQEEFDSVAHSNY